MASFGMVYAGAPLFMWRWCIQCAVFINNLTATYFSEEMVWATPFELEHGEPYPDASIVVPFGCAALVRLRNDDQEKFKPKCALMIFIHYAMKHPLYTYALYSPMTKKVIYRQDVIFLTNVFPMREARIQGGSLPDGEKLEIVKYRSPKRENDVSDKELSFEQWEVQDELPPFQDHVKGFSLVDPKDDTGDDTLPRREDCPSYTPDHPAFGPESCVKVPIPFEIMIQKDEVIGVPTPQSDQYETEIIGTDRSMRSRDNTKVEMNTKESQLTRRPVKDRWFYETIPMQMGKVTESNLDTVNSLTMSGEESSDIVGSDETTGSASAMSIEDKPHTLGPLLEIGAEVIEEIEDAESGAYYLQGTIFYDNELHWCRITGWGTDNGITLVYYVPVTSVDLVKDEEHTTLTEILS
jgi:hypothetical protein